MSTESGRGLDAIQPPASPPTDAPDLKTQLEEKANRPKPLTPTEHLVQVNRDHVESLRQQIADLNKELNHHKGRYDELKEEYADHGKVLKQDHKEHCDKLLAEVANLRAEGMAAQVRAEHFVDRCARLESSANSSGTFGVLATIAAVVGGGLIGYPGSMPGVSDIEKASFTGEGIAALAASVILSVVGVYVGRPGRSPFTEPRKPPIDQPPIRSET